MTDKPAFPPPNRRTRRHAIIRIASRVFLALFAAAHVIADQVSDPALVASSGSAQAITVTVSDSTPGATIYYTTSGTNPTTSSATVASGGSVTVSQGTTLKVQAYYGASTPSNVVSATYAPSSYLSAGPQHTLALQNSSLFAWGANQAGQLGTGTQTNASTPVKVNITGITPIAGFAS